MLKKIQCENYFCIYFYKGICRLDNICISTNGTCDCCIYVDISEEYLEDQRDKLLKMYDEM